MEAPCDEPDGILSDGTCRFGMPSLMPENRMAVRFFSDINSLGELTTLTLWDIEITDHERGDLLMKLRVLKDEVNKVTKAKLKDV